MKKILSIDGGGIRGVAPARLLSHLEGILRGLGKGGVADVFDMFVGTSTGCIIAAGLAASDQVEAGPITPESIFDLYYARGAELFVPTPFASLTFDLYDAKYRTIAKNAVLRSLLGDITLGQLTKNFLGTFYSLRPVPGAVFAQGDPTYRARPHGNSKYDELLVSEVVNASSSAPMYFDPWPVGGHQFFGVDGGIFANNPAVCAYVEGLKMFGPDADILIVSVGCGAAKAQFPMWTKWGLLRWASPAQHVPLLEAIFDAQATTIDNQMKLLRPDPARYFRFQYDLPAINPPPIDDVSTGNLDRIKSLVDAYVAQPEVEASLRRVADLL